VNPPAGPAGTVGLTRCLHDRRLARAAQASVAASGQRGACANGEFRVDHRPRRPTCIGPLASPRNSHDPQTPPGDHRPENLGGNGSRSLEKLRPTFDDCGPAGQRPYSPRRRSSGKERWALRVGLGPRSCGSARGGRVAAAVARSRSLGRPGVSATPTRSRPPFAACLGRSGRSCRRGRR
jgi:hypothetical protein